MLLRQLQPWRRLKGLILVSSGIEFDKFQQARDEILHQLEEIRQGNMEDWELEGTRRTMIGAHLATLDVQDRQEDFWLGQTAAGLETGIEELVAQLEQSELVAHTTVSTAASEDGRQNIVDVNLFIDLTTGEEAAP